MRLDASQQAVTHACAAPCALSVIGAAGTGKSSLLRALVSKILGANPQARIAVLSPDRRAATDLRNAISVDAGVLSEHVTIQSITAFAYSIVSSFAQALGRREPELLSGPDQDVLLKELFDLINEGAIPGVLPAEGESGYMGSDVTELPAFRAEFRDLITRAAELGLSAGELGELGARYDKPMWHVGASVMEIYEAALATEAATSHDNPDRIDHARLVTYAARAIENWDESVARAPAGVAGIERPAWDWVFVDDIHNATLGLLGLLRALQADGSSVVTFGDPDLAVQGFRGGVPHLPALVTRDKRAGGLGAERYYLGIRYRGHEGFANVIGKVTAGIHTAGAGRHRTAEFEGADAHDGVPSEGVCGGGVPPEGVRALAFRNESDQVAYLATGFRRLHLDEGVSYSDMAVITRSHSDHAHLRRSFIRHGVPVQAIYSPNPLREQSAVAALMDLIRISLAEPDSVEPEELIGVLTGRLLAIDPLELRHIRRELRGWELLAGGNRPDDDLLAQVLEAGEDNQAEKIPALADVRRVIFAIRRAGEPGRMAEDVLWSAWDSLKVAEQWRAVALETSALGDAANSDLDAVMQLFRVAQRLADRDPVNATIDRLFEVLEQQDLPEDSIARTGSSVNEITLATPSSTIGQSWKYVAIVGLNEGVWPNTRLRNPLTRVPELASIVIGNAMGASAPHTEQVYRDVIDDELRMLLQSVTRASQGLVLSCLRGEEQLPSRFLEMLVDVDDMHEELEGEAGGSTEGGAAGKNTEDARPKLVLTTVATSAATLDSDGLVGELRQALERDELREHAQRILNKLANAGVRAADSRTWVDEMEFSSTASAASGPISVSPSRIETILKCPMRGFLQGAGASSIEDRHAANLGTLIHTIAEETSEPNLQEMLARLDELWPQLGLREGYYTDVEHARATQMVTYLYDYLKDAPRDADEELWARAELGNVRINARIDRLERDPRHPEKVVVADFKTGGRIQGPGESDTIPQLLVYQWLVNSGGVQVPEGRPPAKKSLGAKIVHIGTTNKKLALREQSEMGESMQEQAEQVILRAADYQRGPDFVAHENKDCVFCEFATICPVKDGERIFS